LTFVPWFSWLALPDFDIFLMHKSSTNTTAWFLVRSFEDLCAKSFLMLAIFVLQLRDFDLGLLPVMRGRCAEVLQARR